MALETLSQTQAETCLEGGGVGLVTEGREEESEQ